MKISININGYVLIKPNEEGFKIWHEYYQGYTDKTIEDYKKGVDEDGYVRMQLWEVMKIFGEHLSMAHESPINTTIIYDNKH
jgi:hypothetical protein